MGDARIREVVNFLQSKYIKISPQNEWLQGCSEWFNSNNSNASTQQLQNFVYDQWLLADLHEIGEIALPSNLSNLYKTCLRNSFVLQIDSVLNVGESCYSQLQKIRNVSNINLEVTETKPQSWEPKSRRMLKLTCTDGVQTVYGMEYQPISCLKEPFIPGLKILITGPVECRRGVLLLGPQNIQIIGGEADSLIVKNAMENVLARALNLEENLDPFSQSRFQNDVSDAQTVARVNTIDRTIDAPVTQHQERREPTIDEFSDDNDDIFLCEQLTQVENQFRINSSQPPTRDNETSNNVPSIFNSCETNRRPLFSSDSKRTSTVPRKIGVACPIISPNNFPAKRSAPSPTNLDFKITKTTIQDVPFPSTSTGFKTFREIENPNIKDLKQIKLCCTRKCTACVKKITSKPRIREDKWQLSAEIGDDTGILEVLFSDTFLEEIFEFSAVEIASQKERVRTNPDVKERIDKILVRGIQKVMSLHGQFEISFSSDLSLPVVLNMA